MIFIHWFTSISREGVEPTNTHSLNTILKKLREKTALKIYPSRTKWIDHDDKFNYNVYIIELNLNEKPE